MATPALPEGWTEERDPQGRLYYSNHATMLTSWERPTAAVTGAPPPYSSNSTGQQQQQQQSTKDASGPRPPNTVGQENSSLPGLSCDVRTAFWIVAIFGGWFVWIFAVVAGADDEWIDIDREFPAGGDFWLDGCDQRWWNDDFCDKYRAFTAMQIIATILCSVAVVMFTAMLFRPEEGGFGSVKFLGMIAIILMGLYAFFQMIAFSLVVGLEKDYDVFSPEVSLGDTFGVGVVGWLFGMVLVVLLVILFHGSGEGPFYHLTVNCVQERDLESQAQGQPKQSAVNPQIPVPVPAPATEPSTATMDAVPVPEPVTEPSTATMDEVPVPVPAPATKASTATMDAVPVPEPVTEPSTATMDEVPVPVPAPAIETSTRYMDAEPPQPDSLAAPLPYEPKTPDPQTSV